MSALKIAVNTRLLIPNKIEGIGQFTVEIFKRLVKDHPEVEFHFFFDRPYSKQFVFAENVKGHVLHPQARHPILFRWWYDISVARKLRQLGVDLFISPDAMLSLTTQVPQLLVMHDLNFEHYPKDLPGRHSRYWRKMSPRFADKATRIVTVSNFSKQDISTCYQVSADKIDVVGNAAAEIYRPLSAEAAHTVRVEHSNGKPYFLFVGSIHPRKNLQRLLPAFDRYKSRTNSDVKLLVVGHRFWVNSEIQRAYDTMRHKQDVIFAGHLNTEVLSQVVGAAHAMAYVSYFEGFGIPIVEAFQAGVPVVTSNVSSMPEIAGQAALVVDPFSIDEITQALQQIDEDQQLREKLIHAGLERARLYNWDASAHAFWVSILKTLKDKGLHA